MSTQLSSLIADRIRQDANKLLDLWQTSTPVRHVFVDRLLDDKVAREISSRFPPASELSKKNTMREQKSVGVALDNCAPILSEILYAFQAHEVVDAIGQALQLKELHPDPTLYASGLSAMTEGGFLNPHLDNSHDGDQKMYRVLNLLYYVTPDWKLEYGGNLELWNEELTKQVTVEAAFNRLVLMETNVKSWHSVSKVTFDGQRNCVSNYYFSPTSPSGSNYSHVTSFAGRPDDTLPKRIALSLDRRLLNLAGRAFPFLLKRTSHRISKDKQE